MRKFRLFLSIFILSYCSSLFAAEPVATVNINTADVSELSAALIGVGQSKAKAIVAYRESYGPFQSVDELVAVKGIGESLLSKNREHIVLK